MVYLDSYNFMIYYNFFGGILSLGIIPYIRKRGASLILKGVDLQLCFYSAVSLVAATLLFTVMLEMSGGVVIPTPGNFI